MSVIVPGAVGFFFIFVVTRVPRTDLMLHTHTQNTCTHTHKYTNKNSHEP